jgi:tripeptidyl-peptidase-1
MVASGELVTSRSGRDDDGEVITPEFLHWLYNSFAYEPAATDQNVLGIAGYEEYPNPEDLTTFMDYYHGPGADATFTVVEVNDGGYDPDNPGLEANVDVQYTEVMAYPTPVIYYSTGENPGQNDYFLVWLNYVLDQDDIDIPQTISTSYVNYEKDTPLEYARTVCDKIAELGARGVSVLFASGDYGVGRECDAGGQFLPTFPASCMCDVFSACKQYGQVVHYTATLSQVPMSLPLEEQRATPRSQRASRAADFRTSLSALPTKLRPCPPS